MRALSLVLLTPVAITTPAFAGGDSHANIEAGHGPEFRLSGLFFGDAAWLDGYAAKYTDDHESDLRLAEVALHGSFGNLDAVVGYDFARDGEWRDVGLTYRHDHSRFTFGQFKEPASLDKLTPQGGTVFLETARFTKAFGLGRRLGVTATYASSDFSLTAGVFNGNLDDNELAGFGSGQVAYSARATWRPVHTEDTDLHFGAYARQLDYDGEGVKIGPVPHTVLASKTLKTSLTGGYSYPLAEDSTLLGFEAAIRQGALYASGEFASFTVDTDQGEETLTGAYAQVSYALTGESRSYYYGKGVFKPIKPANPVTEGGIGAWEVAARIDHLDLSGFEAGESTSYTAGINWTPVEGVRVMANYVAERGDSPAGDSDLWAMRLQLRF